MRKLLIITTLFLLLGGLIFFSFKNTEKSQAACGCGSNCPYYCSPEFLGNFFQGAENISRAQVTAMAESGCNPLAVNKTLNPNGTCDFGLFQINSIHCGKTINGVTIPEDGKGTDCQGRVSKCEEFLLDPANNAKIAAGLSCNGQDFCGPAYGGSCGTIWYGARACGLCSGGIPPGGGIFWQDCD